MSKVHDPKTDAQIHHGRREKLRQSFQKYGLHTFNETQVLEYALGMTMPRIDTNPLAHRLVNTFGSLDGVISAPPDKIMAVAGAGTQVAHFLSFLKEFIIYHASIAKKDEKVKTSADASRVLREVMKNYAEEHFVVLCLDKSGGVVLKHDIAGNFNKVDINMREVADVILRTKAVSIVCAHNHLDEIATPSDSDIRLTRTIVNMLGALEINVLDHIIFGADSEYSFFRSGILDILKREHKAFTLSKDYEELIADNNA